MEEVSIKIEDSLFPKELKRITNPPKEIFCVGDLDLLKGRKIAVVGSRKHSLYGKQIAGTIAGKLAENGIVIVSGLAVGIDAVGHQGALNVDGKTIAVLGCGLDVDYPARNRKLRKIIEEKGLVITEYPRGTPGNKFTFPMRNRIISGLSEGVVVVEAGLNSGSLITAGLANEQGKMVYSVPGNINSIYSMGTNMLIRDGATPLFIVDDLLRDLGIDPAMTEKEIRNLSESENQIYLYVKTHGEVTTDDIAKALQIQVGQAIGMISIMEMKGVLATAMGKVFFAK